MQVSDTCLKEYINAIFMDLLHKKDVDYFSAALRTLWYLDLIDSGSYFYWSAKT